MKAKKQTKEIMDGIKSNIKGHIKGNGKRIKKVGKDLDELIAERKRGKNNGN